MRLVITGGGGFRVPLIHRALAAASEPVIDDLVLHDVSQPRLQAIAAVLEESPTVRVSTTTSLTDALAGADFVFSAIRVGGAAGRVADERRALSRGILGQETVGAGGLAYGLRTLPVALQLARTIADVAPQAWTVNFTNPAGLVTEALRPVLGDRVIGICDSPAGLIERACRAAGVASSTVEADYLGINHLGWLRALRIGGSDLLPALIAADATVESFEEGRIFGAPLLRALHAIPNEYLLYYYRTDEVLAALRDGPTRGEFLAAEQDAFYAAALSEPDRAAQLWAQTRRRREETYLAEAGAQAPRDEQDLAGGGYEGIALALMTALAGGPAARLIVNVANGTTVPQLPAELVIETACDIDATGAHPRPAAPLTLHQLGLVASVRAAEQGIIDAVTTGSRAAALRAFTIHPLVGTHRLADELLADVLSADPELAARLH